jgi:hypothetical protein
MASEYAKLKALAKRLKEPEVPRVDFGLGDPVNYVQNISDIYDNTDNKFINHPVHGPIKENQIKQFDSLDKTTYPSDPIQQRKLKDEKLFQNILPRLKIKGNKIKGKKTKADYSNFKIVDPKITETKSIPETPQEDIETIINRRAEQSRIRQRDNFIKSYGQDGLPNVIANREGLFDE